MNKTELVAEVAERADLTKAEAAAAVDAFFEVVTETLQKGGQVSLIGFGTFKVGTRSARKGRNPQTGETIDIPAAKVPKFTAGKALKDAVNR